MARLYRLAALGVLSAGLTGCVSAQQYSDLKIHADQLSEQLARSEGEISRERAAKEAAERQLAAVNNAGATQMAASANLQQQLDEMMRTNKDLMAKYAMTMDTVGKVGTDALPQPLSNALATFAEQNPGLIEFDRTRGVVKFKSDVTFAVGDATLRPEAKEVIRRFATILNSGGAGTYELMVAGHTDSTPVHSQAVIKHGHFDNWYLSAHRAIAVKSELTVDGVEQRRVAVVGYADQRPIASNSTEAGKTANRRVEVMILPTTVAGGGEPAPVAEATEPRTHRGHGTPAGTAMTAGSRLNKDGPTATTLNK